MTKETRRDFGEQWKRGDERLHYPGSHYEDFYLEFKAEIDKKLVIPENKLTKKKA